MNGSTLSRIGCLALGVAGMAWGLPSALAQSGQPSAVVEESPDEAKERIAAERFLELLKKRPRLGTALDKVYGFHVGRGTLESFGAELEQQAAAANDGNLWLVLGMVQMQRGQDAAAAVSLETAEKLLPEEPLASYYLGKTLVLLGDVDEGAAAMRRAIERKPPRPDLLAVFQDLGRIYQRTGRNDEALDVWKNLESLFPGDLQVREQIAVVLAEEGAAQAALERFEALATAVPDRFRKVELAIRAAQLKAQLGKTDEALADFERQLAQVNPDSWLHRDVRRRIEDVFWSSGDIDGLVGYYTGWIERNPDDVDAMMRAARVLAAQRRLPEAEKWFRDAITKAPSQVEPRLALAEALAAADRFADAAVEMEQLVKLQPDNPDYIVRWGEMVFNDGERSEADRRSGASDIWRRMLAKRGDDPVTVARVADLLRGADATEAAIEQYRAAIVLAPNEPQYREYLGEYLHQLGRKDEALAEWRQLASGERETRDNLVRLSEVLGTFHYDDEALSTIAKACDMKPTFGQRARYAELLREAQRYDDALAQLDLAEPLAEDPELREVVLTERIKNYQASGALAERIEQAEQAVAGDRRDDPAQWRLLALLREADRKFQLACDAIDKAVELAPGDTAMWETAAALQERSGRYGDAVASYRKLSTLDRRFLTNYLTQIAQLEMRLGNVDAAIAAGEELIAAAPGNSEHYRMFADLCMSVGNSQRALDVLRRNVRTSPNDVDATIQLARMLADELQSDEAIEHYWRAFELANDLDAKTPVVEAMAELYLRTNRFDAFIERLDVVAREQNKPRDGLLWSAAAHQAAGDLGRAKELLEQLARTDSRDTKLLERLVGLARAEYDFEAAADYQKRLVAAAPTPEAEYLLANLLLELGEIDEAESAWIKLSQRGGDSKALASSLNALIGKEEFATAAVLLEKALAKNPDDWELLMPAMFVYIKLDRGDEARRIAEQTLALRIDPGELSRAAREQIEKQRRAAQPQQYNPYENLSTPERLLHKAHQLREALAPTGRYGGVNPYGQSFATASCFQDTQAMALCVPLAAPAEGFDADAFVKQLADDAIASDDSEKLWRALFCMVWQDPNAPNQGSSSDAFQRCVDALIKLRDPGAAAHAMARFVNQRRSNLRGKDQAPPLTADEIKQLKEWAELASGDGGTNTQYYVLYIVAELYRAGDENADRLLSDQIEKIKAGPNAQMMLMQAMSIMASSNYGAASPKSIDKALELFRESLAAAPSTSAKNNNAQYYAAVAGGLLESLATQNRLADALGVYAELERWHAQRVAEMRPAQRERLQSSAAPLTYGTVGKNNQYEQRVVSFPPVSAFFGAEMIQPLHMIFERCKSDEAQRKQLRDALAAAVAEPTDDPYLAVARLLAASAEAYWSDDKDRAQALLASAGELPIDSQFISLARSRILYDSGKTLEALQTIESIRPSNQQMLVDRELAILQLVLQLGDLERAKQSAQKLFALRLHPDTEFKLADLMQQLGMSELSERMLGRIRRRAGGRQDALLELMTRYAAAGNNESAAEIARQVIRRTSPRSSQTYSTAENQQHEQAVRVLAQVGALQPLVEQYEGLVERSPKSTKLVDKLCAFYEAAGRRDDAQKLRMKSVDASPEDPRSLFAAAQQLAGLGKHSEAVDKFVAAVVKSPEMLEQNYYSMRSSMESAKAYDRLADAIVKAGVRKFSRVHQIQELYGELQRQKNEEALNRLMIAAWSELNLQELSQQMYSYNRQTFKPGPQLAKLVADKLTAPDAPFNVMQYAYVRSRGSDGRTSGFVDFVAQIVAADESLRKRIDESLTARLEKSEELFPRTLLCLVRAEAKDFDGLKQAMQPLLEKQDKTGEDGQAIWTIASTLAHQLERADLACEALDAVDAELLVEQYDSGFEYSAEALKAFAYQKAGRNADAHRILVDKLRNAAVDESRNRGNPGYGEYQYIRSMSGLSEKFVEMGYLAEAFLAYHKAYDDQEMLDRAKRWGGNWEYQRDRLREQIDKKRDEKSILGVVEAALKVDEANEKDGAVSAFLIAPQIERRSLIDTRVSMPLEQFLAGAADAEPIRKAISQWLVDNPLPDDASAMPLQSLVSRLVVCDSVDNDTETAATAAAVIDWSRSHQRPGDDAKADDSQASSIESEELLLAIAALRISGDATESEEAVRMFERASTAAESRGETGLVSSLRCQIARRIASADSERARAIFQSALDDLLPLAEGASDEAKTDAENAAQTSGAR